MKRIVAVALVMMMTLAMFASVAAAAQEFSGELVITIGNLDSEARVNMMDELVERFKSRYPGVNVELSSAPWANYTTLIRTKAAAGDLPDIIFGSPAKFSDVIEAGKVLNLSEEGEFLASLPLPGDVYGECTIDGNIFAVPQTSKAWAVFYNKDIFAEKGFKVPQTNTEFLQLLADMQAAGVRPFVNPFANITSLYVNLKMGLVPQLAMNGHSDYYAQLMSGQAKFRDYPEYENSLADFAKRLEYMAPDDIAVDTTVAIQQFASGTGAMYMANMTAVVGPTYAVNPNFNMGAFVYPWSDDASQNKYVTELEDVWMINQDTRQKELAFAFIRFMFEPDNAALFAQACGMIMLQTDLPEGSVRDIVEYLMEEQKAGRFVQNCSPQPVGEFVSNYRSYLQVWVADPNRSVDTMIDEGQAIYDAIIASAT